MTEESSGQTSSPTADLEHRRNILGAEADAYNTERQDSVTHSVSFALLSVRTLMVAHGGAIIALLSLIGTFAHEPDLGRLAFALRASLLTFLCGLACAIATSGFAYLNFMTMSAAVPLPWEVREFMLNGAPMPDRPVRNLVNPLMYFAIVFAFGSLALLFFGAFRAADALLLIPSFRSHHP